MKHITKLKIAAVHQLCVVNDKSLEYTYQFIQDICKVDLDCVNNYFEHENHMELFKEINSLAEVMANLEEHY